MEDRDPCPCRPSQCRKRRNSQKRCPGVERGLSGNGEVQLTVSTRPPNTARTARLLFSSERAGNGYGQPRKQGTYATATSSHIQLSATSNIESSHSRLG